MFDELLDKMKKVTLAESSGTKYTFSRDVNGNKLLKVSVKGEGGFSIQTNTNMPKTHKMTKDDSTISAEVKAYVTAYGTKRQKEILGVKDESK